MWHARVERLWPDAAAHARGLAWLTGTERARYDRFRHDVDREMFLAGRVLARSLVGRTLGIAPDRWPWREGPRGRPEIGLARTPLSFNIAHSGGLVVCALAREAEVGVDVEDRHRASLDRDLVARYCSPAEAADIDRHGDEGWRDRFLEYWTLKEAYLKARGLGIAVHLADLSFTIGDGAVRVDFLESLADADRRWAFDLRAFDATHIIAAAASTTDETRPAFTLAAFPPAWLP